MSCGGSIRTWVRTVSQPAGRGSMSWLPWSSLHLQLRPSEQKNKGLRSAVPLRCLAGRPVARTAPEGRSLGRESPRGVLQARVLNRFSLAGVMPAREDCPGRIVIYGSSVYGWIFEGSNVGSHRCFIRDALVLPRWRGRCAWSCAPLTLTACMWPRPHVHTSRHTRVGASVTGRPLHERFSCSRWVRNRWAGWYLGTSRSGPSWSGTRVLGRAATWWFGG